MRQPESTVTNFSSKIIYEGIEVIATAPESVTITENKAGIEYENTAEKALKATGIFVNGQALQAVSSFVAPPHQRDRVLLDALKKDSPVDLAGRI